MGKRKDLAILIAWAFLAGGLSAQAPGGGNPPQKPKPAYTFDGETVTFVTDELQGIPLLEFIKLAQKVTGKVFINNLSTPGIPGPGVPGAPNMGGTKISFIGPKRVHKENFFAFFQTILRIYGYAVVKRGEGDTEVYEVAALNSQKRNDVKSASRFIPCDELEQYARDEGTVVLTTVKFKYMDPRQAASTLRPLFTDSANFAQVVSVGDSNSVVIMGFAPFVWTIYRMIKLVDVPPDIEKPKVEILRLQYASADELEPIISDLVTASSGTKGGRRQGVSGRLMANYVEPKIMAEPRTNSLIVVAMKEDLPNIEELVVKLDTQVNTVEGDYHVVQLTNVLAENVANTLRQFLLQADQAQQRALQGRGQRRVNREIRPVVIPDKKSNSLLIMASKTRYAELLKLIERLDVRRPQVLIEAALVEVDVNGTLDFGAELGLVDVGGESSDWKRPFGFTSFGLSEFQDTDGNGIPDLRLPNFSNPPKGLLGGIITGGDFSIPLLLHLNQSDQLANVLSIPSVLVNDNEGAVVTSTKEVPTQTSNQGTATTSTGFSGYQKAGITLSISPSISESNYLKLNIDLEVSRFLGSTTNAALPPDKITRKISTKVTIPNGHTLVLGGVLQDDYSDGNTGIPILKDIPLLGWLFSSTSKTSDKLNLYFFITPYIMDEKDFSDLKALSYQTKLEAQQYIGKERIQLVDRKWTGGNRIRIDDSNVSLEDLERLGGLELPVYKPPKKGERKLKPGEAPPVEILRRAGSRPAARPALPEAGAKKK